MTTIFTAFTNMLDELGIEPTGNTLERMQKERELMVALEKVREFPIDELPQISAYAIEHKVRNPEKLIREMNVYLKQKPVQYLEGDHDKRILTWAGDAYDRACRCGEDRCGQYINHVEDILGLPHES